jgi:hypothetical protein
MTQGAEYLAEKLNNIAMMPTPCETTAIDAVTIYIVMRDVIERQCN